MNPRGITFYSESNPKAAKVANKKARLKQLMSAGHTKKRAQQIAKWGVLIYGYSCKEKWPDDRR